MLVQYRYGVIVVALAYLHMWADHDESVLTIDVNDLPNSMFGLVQAARLLSLHPT